MILCRYIHGLVEYCHSYDGTPDQKNFRLHTHDAMEIYCFLGGKGIFHVEGSEYPLSPGDVLVIRPAEAHFIEIDGSEPYERVSINFPANLFASLDPEGILTEPFFRRRGGMLNCYQKAVFRDDFRTLVFQRIEEADDPLTLKTYLLVLLTEIAGVFRSGSVQENPVETMEYRIIRHINNHLGDRITIQSLSARFFLSPSQLDRRFKKATGITIAEYINTKRMIRARTLLAEGVRATEVAARTGFSDYSAFYRAYRKKFGVSPRESTGTTPVTEETALD